MSYCNAVRRREVEELSYRTYVTDSLQAYAKGQYLKRRWYDAAHPAKVREVKPGSVIESMIERGGLVIEDESARPCS